MLAKLFSLTLAAAVFVASTPADAGELRKQSYRADGTRVKGYVERRGGYSYNYADSVNTYGDSRSRYGAASVYRDPRLDQQTNSGPFDHGYFFNSGIGLHGGDSPYLN